MKKMKKTNNSQSFWRSNLGFVQFLDIQYYKFDIRHPLSILAFFTLFSTILTAQPIFKTYPNTNGGTAIGEYNNGANYFINTCTGNQAAYLWTDGQGNLLNTERDFVGSCGQYRIDATTYIKTDAVGSQPNRDIRFQKLGRNGAVLLEKTYPQALDNVGQFVSPTKDGGFIIAGNTQVTMDTLYRVQLTKIDVNGNLQWHKTVNVPNLNYSNAFIPNRSTCYAVFTVKTINIKEIGQASDGGFYITYTWEDVTPACGYGFRNANFIIRTNAVGDFMWQKGKGTSEVSGSISYKILPSDNGSLFVLDSRSNGGHHIQIYSTYEFKKISASGDTLWTFSGQRNPSRVEGQINKMHAFSLTPDNNIIAHTSETVVKTQPLVENSVIKLNAQTGRFMDSMTVQLTQSKAIISTKDGGFALVGGETNATFFYKNKFGTSPNLPDLTLANLTLPTSPIYENQLLKWKIDIKNIGSGNASSNFSVKTYVSTDNVFSANDRLYSTIPTGNYDAGFSVLQVSDSTTTPRTIPAGQYYLIAKVDADNQITESNKNNNILVSATKITVTATPKPDLIITGITVDLTPNPAANGTEYLVNAKITFKNIGTAALTGTLPLPNYLWLSTNPNDTLLSSTFASSTFALPPTLAVGASTTVSVPTFGLPTYACGRILYWQAAANVVVGNARTVSESNFVNNFFGGVPLVCPTISTNDIALSMTSTYSAYIPYQLQNYRVTAVNNGTTAFTSVKIKFTRPNLTVNGGSKTASTGTFQDFCSGGVECSEWTIPSFSVGATATLDVPVYILNPTGNITATATLLSSTPIDNVVANNTVSLTTPNNLTPVQAPTSQALAFRVPTQLIPVVIQRISPNPTEGDVQIKLDSWTKQTVDFNFTDITGKTIYSEKRDLEKGMNRLDFEVFHLPQGVYFIQTNVGKGKDVPTKFLKM
jgi:hypothetical protein